MKKLNNIELKRYIGDRLRKLHQAKDDSTYDYPDICIDAMIRVYNEIFQLIQDDKSEVEFIDDATLDWIADLSEYPEQFLYSIMREARLTDRTALRYLDRFFGFRYSKQDLKEIIKEYRSHSKKGE